jgi:hypothetical protein
MPALVDLLAPILQHVAALRPAERTSEADARALLDSLRGRFPEHGADAHALATALRSGVADGSLCDRGDANARFSRVAKPGPDTCGLSVDVVSLEGEALRHRHPRGEVTFAIAADPSSTGSRFDGEPPGWVFRAPGSEHVPTVTGPRMILLYFLPEGAIEWTG